MKNIIAIALFLAASFVATGSASAQDHSVKATVPFSFTVGTTTLPPGTYTISSGISAPEVLAINNWDKKVHALTIGMGNQTNSKGENKLVFHHYGGQYFLSEIRCANSPMNLDLHVSKAENRARAQSQEANLRVESTVMVALR